jgi:hypothetical protein
MDTGAPEPLVHREGTDAWVAYHAFDPSFPGYAHPDCTKYLDEHAGEYFGLLRFRGVSEASLGPPNDERLAAHPLYAKGLTFYSFHQADSHDHQARWVVTFHDETLVVRAESAEALRPLHAASATEAINETRRLEQSEAEGEDGV